MPSIPGRFYYGVAFTTVLGHACFAQTVNEPDEAGVLQEVVFTSQRRVENLQDVPIAATALDADALETKVVVQLADLQSAAPSLSITNAGQTQSVNIRGPRTALVHVLRSGACRCLCLCLCLTG